MSSARFFLGGFAFLLALSVAAGDDFCSNVADDWNSMKNRIESLRDNSAEIEKLVTDLRSLSTELNNLKAKIAQSECGSGGSTAAAPSTTSATTTIPAEETTSAIVIDENLKEVLHKSMLFYEAQRSGKLPESNRIPWRSDSALDDKGLSEEDLTGGWYDAGDFLKLGLPMASSVTMLAWGMIEYRNAYSFTGELENGLDCIKWPLDYFIKAHVDDNKFYAQVGDSKKDHDYWGRPEDMTMDRPASMVDSSNGGSDVAAETAAAMAAASIVFRPTNSTYADILLDHSRKLFAFAYNYKKKYDETIADAKKTYPSTSYEDELAWGAMWLYKSTNEADYLQKAEEFLSSSNVAWAMSWDDKNVGAQLLYYNATGNAEYKDVVEQFLTNWFPGGNVPYTNKGLAFRSKWGSLRYSANVAFVALVAADNGIKTEDGRNFAKSQIDYIMGSSGRSYIVGYGQNSPVQPHHAASSCPSPPDTCDWEQADVDAPNPQVLYGAMVGGPVDTDDTYADVRTDYVANEVTTDYNAGLQSAVAGLLKLTSK